MALWVVSKNYSNIFIGQQFFHSFRTPLAWFGLAWASVFSNNLALYLKEFKSTVFAILFIK